MLTIHIGFHKTGTSFLQGVVYGRHPGLLFGDPAASSRWAPFQSAAEAHDFDYDPDRLRVAVGEPDRPVLVSWEGLVGDPFAGAHMNTRIAERLAQTFPDARIVITVREQRAMVESLYRQYVAEGGIASALEFAGGDTGRVHFSINYLRYERLIERYRALFGAGQVLVLLYEQLREDWRSVAAQVFQFAGVDPGELDPSVEGRGVNRRLSRWSVGLSRRTNALLSSPIAPVTPLGRTRVSSRHLRRVLQNRIDPLIRSAGLSDEPLVPERSIEPHHEAFRSTNRWLAETLELPVADHGYL